METKRFCLQTALTNFMPLPRCLLELHLPSTALVIYAMLLDRGTLSQRNDYTDFGGWVYVVYPIRELADILRITDSAVKKNLQILEKHDLIRKVRRSRAEANRIFLFLPEDTRTATGRGDPFSAEDDFIPRSRGKKEAPSNLRKQPDKNELYLHGEGESL